MTPIKDMLPGEFVVCGIERDGKLTRPIEVLGCRTAEQAAIEAADSIHESIWSGDVHAFAVIDHKGKHERIELRGEVKTVWTRHFVAGKAGSR